MNDRLNRYFSKYADEYVFLELMPEYVKKERLDFMRGVPLPIRRKYALGLADQQGIDFKYFTMGMINMLGIDPSFEYASKYAMLLKYMNPAIDRIIVNVGIGLAQTGHLEDACITFRAARMINPDSMDALYNYMLACRDLYEKSQDNAFVADFKEEVFETLLYMKEVDPDFPKTYYYLGFAYINAGRYSMAEHEWRIFLQKTGPCPEQDEIREHLAGMEDALLIERSYTDIINGQWEKGVRSLEVYKGTEMMEDWWPLSYYLGVGYSRLGQYEDALEMLKIAVRKNPSSPEIYAELVMVNEALGDEVNTEKYRRKLEIFNRPPDQE